MNEFSALKKTGMSPGPFLNLACLKPVLQNTRTEEEKDTSCKCWQLLESFNMLLDLTRLKDPGSHRLVSLLPPNHQGSKATTL